MIYTALLLGFMGSIHCIGMCGPLVMAFAVDHKATKTGNFINNIIYHSGRITSYAALGLLFGILGSFFQLVEFQKIISIILGLLMIGAFIFSFDFEAYIHKIKFIKSFYSKVNNLIYKMIAKADGASPFVLGLLNGILPCGLVYIALAGALASESLLSSVTFMIVFGLGNAPVLIALAIGARFISIKENVLVKHVFSIALLLTGIILISRGLNIDLPTNLEIID